MPFAPGERISAELVFFRSAAPLRAVVAERKQAAGAAAWPFAARRLAEALAAYERVLQVLPWTSEWPLACADAVVARLDETLVLSEAGSGLALPVDAAQSDALLPLVGLEPVTVAGLWDGRRLTMLAAETPLGGWLAE
jgi:hypothetical protein